MLASTNHGYLSGFGTLVLPACRVWHCYTTTVLKQFCRMWRCYSSPSSITRTVHDSMQMARDKTVTPTKYCLHSSSSYYNRSDQTNGSNYRCISLSSTMFKILSNNMLSGLTREFRHNRSTTDHILCIHQISERKSEYSQAKVKPIAMKHLLVSNYS